MPDRRPIGELPDTIKAWFGTMHEAWSTLRAFPDRPRTPIPSIHRARCQNGVWVVKQGFVDSADVLEDVELPDLFICYPL